MVIAFTQSVTRSFQILRNRKENLKILTRTTRLNIRCVCWACVKRVLLLNDYSTANRFRVHNSWAMAFTFSYEYYSLSLRRPYYMGKIVLVENWQNRRTYENITIRIVRNIKLHYKWSSKCPQPDTFLRSNLTSGFVVRVIPSRGITF